MNSILERFFQFVGFKTHSIETDKKEVLFAIKNDNSISYLVLGNTPEVNDVRDVCDWVSEALPENKIWHTSLLKTTLLVFLDEVENLEELGPNVNHLKIEEDKYMFKKHVLQFCSAEVEMLNQLLKKQKGWGDIVTNDLFDDEAFDHFKENGKIPSAYSLLMKIMVKVPILEVTPHRKELEDIESQIEEDLLKKELTGIRDFLLELNEDESESEQLKVIETFYKKYEKN